MKEKKRQQILRAARALTTGHAMVTLPREVTRRLWAGQTLASQMACAHLRADHAVEAGATNIRLATCNGSPVPWAGLVADWPAHYFAR